MIYFRKVNREGVWERVNLGKLKGKICEEGKNYKQCAAAIGKSVTSFNSKINGRRSFYIEELDMLGDFLNMTGDEKAEIFLS